LSIDTGELENWAGRLWKTDTYWLLTCGNRVAITPDMPVMVKLSELPSQISRGFEFNTKTGAIREVELIRNPDGIFCSLTSGFSAVLFPLPQCPPLVQFAQTITLSRAGANQVSLDIFAPWRTDINTVNVSVEAPGLTINGSANLTIPGNVSISVPTTAGSGYYYIMVKEGNCMPAKKWMRVP